MAANRGTKNADIKQLKSLAQISTTRRIPKNVILLVGGLSDIEYFNPLTKKWRVTTNRQFTLPKNLYHANIEIIGKCLYLIGGKNPSYFRNTLFEFNLERKEWTQKASTSEDRSAKVSTAVHQNKLYVFGGLAGGASLNTGEVFDPETNQWTAISNMIHGRTDSASVIHDGWIYVIGGFDRVTWTFLNSIERYNPETDTWSNVGHLTTGRSGASAVTLGDRIYVMGGISNFSRLSSVECFSFGAGLANLTWHTVPDMLVCRKSFAAFVEENKIFVAGGLKTGVRTCRDVEVFHPSENIWKSSSKLNVARAAMAVSCDNKELNLK